MIMADVLTWFLIIIGVLLVLHAHWIAAYALFPSLVEGSRQRYERRPVAATMLGLVIIIPVLIIGAIIINVLKHPLIAVIIIGIWMIPALLALLGSAGLALRIGAGMGSRSEQTPPYRTMMKGSTVLSLTFLTPILGWFVLLPWTLVSGFGASLMTIRGRRNGTGINPPAPTPNVPDTVSDATETKSTIITPPTTTP